MYLKIELDSIPSFVAMTKSVESIGTAHRFSFCSIRFRRFRYQLNSVCVGQKPTGSRWTLQYSHAISNKRKETKSGPVFPILKMLFWRVSSYVSSGLKNGEKRESFSLWIPDSCFAATLFSSITGRVLEPLLSFLFFGLDSIRPAR